MKEAQNLYSENYKTLLKEIKEDLKKWKDVPGSWFRRVNMAILTQMAIFELANFDGNISQMDLQILCNPEYGWLFRKN